VIEFKDVTVSYPLPDGGSRTVFSNLSVKIGRGEMVYLIGPTGSGKSTLLRMLYMDLIPGRGVTQIGDYRSDTVKSSEIPFLRRSLGVVFQDFQLLHGKERCSRQESRFAGPFQGGTEPQTPALPARAFGR
jgi:cell division transport system ATP-binding protein